MNEHTLSRSFAVPAVRRADPLTWVVSGALLLVLCLTVSGTAFGQQPGGEALSVGVVKPVQGTEARAVTLVGHVKPWQQAVLYSKVAGYLDWIGVDKGSWVKKGELLATIDDPETRLDLERQSAEYDAKRVMYDRLKAARAKNPDMVSQFEIDRAKGSAEAAEAAWERLRRLVANSEIRAPYAGVITDRWVDPGALIQIAVSSQSATARIVRIMSFDTVRIAVEIPEPDCPYITVDLPASVVLPESSGETLAGHLARFSWAIDPTTRTMSGEIDVPNTDRRLRPGMYTTVALELETATGALTIPSEAVDVRGGEHAVWIVRDGRVRRVPVTLGRDNGIEVEIHKGLTRNDDVVVTGRDLFVDGMAVTVVAAAQP